MKRLIIGLTAATLMGGGLVGVSAESASAVCPYTGCVPTSTRVSVTNAPVPSGRGAHVCVTVRTTGSGRPHGTVKLKVTRNAGGVFWANTKTYAGKTCFNTRTLNRTGKYTARAIFRRAPNSAFGSSGGATSFTVR